MKKLLLGLLVAFLLPFSAFAVTGKVLVVGGGGGGSNNVGGGGGAGGVQYNGSITLTARTYQITVDGGGAGAAQSSTPNSGTTDGGSSSFGDGTSTTTATGGGKAGTAGFNGNPSGSGSGDSGAHSGSGGAATGGNTFGHAGGAPGRSGSGDAGSNDGYNSAGGGGAGAVGGASTASYSGAGGAGIDDASIGGLLTDASAGVGGYIAGGGGGGNDTFRSLGTGNIGGVGGGGNGSTCSNSACPGGSGTAYTGGGGGGGNNYDSTPFSAGGNGGSGIVIVEYPTANFTHTGGNSSGTAGAYTWVRFNSTGVLTLSTTLGLQVESLVNPSNISTSSPRFSALYDNASTTALGTSYQIQVDTLGTFSSPYWDSGKKTLASSTPVNIRTPQIFSTTTFALDGTKYYWRIKFWDQAGGEGSWSTTGDYFIMQVAGDYMAKVDDGAFMRYNLGTDGTWIAYDKRGWKYTFGATTNARISDPNLSSQIYRWFLEEIADTNGNKVLYHYTKDGGQVYPTYIDYTDHSGGSLFEIAFATSSRGSNAGFATSSIYGFPVLTRYNVSDVTAAVNGVVVHRYTPTYTTGDNGSRSLLTSMQETGYRDSDGSGALTYPATSFSYQTSTTSWTQVTDPNGYSVGFDVSDTSNNDYGWRLFDINGDGLPDWIKSDGSSQTILLNNGTTWATSTAWTAPLAFSKNNLEQGVRMADVNGDGLIDIIAASSTKVVYINNGTSTWTASSTWAFPESFIDSGNRDQGVQLVDLNGDNMADVIRSSYASTTGTTTAVYTNSGHGWAQDTGWSVPEVLINDLRDSAVRFYDYSGDGLVDIVYSPYLSTSTRAYVNNGRGWTIDPSFVPPFPFASTTASIGAADLGVRFADFNGDGCVDAARAFATDTPEIDLASCTSATSSKIITNTLPEAFRGATSTAYDYGVRMVDINGDGLIDIIRSFYDSGTGIHTHKVYLKNGNTPDLLKEVVNGRGGRTTVTYKGSAAYQDGSGAIENPNLPFVTQTVRTLTTDNGAYLTTGRVIATTTYDYQRGYFYGTSTDPLQRQFAGFGLVTATSAANAVIKTYFHQGNWSDTANGEYNDDISKVGKPYRIETYDQSGNLFSRTINKWGRAVYGDGRNFVKLGTTLTQTFDGDTTHRDTAASTTYNDVTGDISTLVNYGEVSGNSDGTFSNIGTDLASTTYTYAASSTLAAMSLPSRELLTDQSGNTIKDTKWYYDSLATGFVSSGNQTKQENLVAGAYYASTTKTYDAYGNIATSTDPLGNKTGFVYDGYNLFPTTVRNALNQEKLFSYDYSLGKAATTTDENNQTVATDFDNLDRPVVEKQPDFVTPTTLVTKTTYTYTNSTTTPSSVFRSDYLSTATTTDSYTYLDGFDRTIQSKREAESANGWITKDTIYNAIGKVGQESLPYFTTTSAYTAPTTTPSLFVTNSYDALGRVLTTANAVGTTTNTYSDWRLTTTDPLSNKKDFNKDAYGNLASVVEYSSAGATTTYTWNLLGKLTKLTDSSSNIRNFTYDLLGRLTGSEDLHAGGDTSFGTTSRQYDDANLIQVHTPRGTAINYTYDALNRILTEDSTTTASFTDVIYHYDICTNGKGRLCEVSANNAATTTYVYNPIGLTGTEAKEIGTIWATTTTSYLRTGAVDTLTYPEGHQIAYVYNDAGDLNSVRGLAPATTTWSSLIQSTNYGPTGQPTFVDYGNNTQTTYTYDAAHLYRLTRKLTISTSTISGTPEQLLFLGMMLRTKPLRQLALLDEFTYASNTDTTTLPELPLIDVGTDATITPDLSATSTLSELPGLPFMDISDIVSNATTTPSSDATSTTLTAPVSPRVVAIPRQSGDSQEPIYFAEIGQDGSVLRIIAISQANIDTGNWGDPKNWIQTSMDGSIRKNGAGIGYTYDQTRDVFIPPKPVGATIFNETIAQWELPATPPVGDLSASSTPQ